MIIFYHAQSDLESPEPITVDSMEGRNIFLCRNKVEWFPFHCEDVVNEVYQIDLEIDESQIFKTLKNMNISIYKEFLEKGWITKKEYKMLTMRKGVQSHDIDFGCDEALRRGFATHIRIDGELITAKKYLKNKKKKKG